MASVVRSRGCARLIGPLLLVPALAAATAACTTTGAIPTATAPEATGSVGADPAVAAGDSRREVQAAGDLYKANPGNGDAAMRYARALRAIGQRAQAAAVLEQASIRDPGNRAVLAAYGRALADTGNFAQALEVLNRAHTADQPDWSILSVQGAVLDQMGRHEEARRYYASALRIKPDEPSVLSNLGLSYALSKDLKQAEATLRRAASGGRIDPRVRQNLALVVGLQGRFAEAETIARADLPPEEAAANVGYLRHMLAHPNGLAKLPRAGAG
jgi:Flp pilus assembly protein TadD